MGVLACDREGCPSVMCDRLILGRTFYICNSCFAELEHFRSTWPGSMPLSEVGDRIRQFMQSVVGSHMPKPDAGAVEIEAEFRRLTERAVGGCG